MENKNITWSAHEFKFQHKTVLWYVCFVILSLALIGYAVYIRNILTLLTFILIPVVAFILTHQRPKELRYELSTTGVTIGRMFYPYRNIKKFWIIYTQENKSLNFETTAYLNNQFSLQLGKQDPVAVKQFLKNYLQEDLDKEESLGDIFARKIRF